MWNQDPIDFFTFSLKIQRNKEVSSVTRKITIFFCIGINVAHFARSKVYFKRRRLTTCIDFTFPVFPVTASNILNGCKGASGYLRHHDHTGGKENKSLKREWKMWGYGASKASWYFAYVFSVCTRSKKLPWTTWTSTAKWHHQDRQCHCCNSIPWPTMKNIIKL